MMDAARFKDFSLSPEPIIMKIAPDEFKCYPEIPLDVLMDVAEVATTSGTGVERMKQMMELFAGIMEPASYETFQRRCRRGTVESPNPHPIGMRHIKEMLPWAMEVYGLRPTQESSESSDGSEPTDFSLTDDAFEEASTS